MLSLGVFHLHSVSSGIMKISCIVPLALSIPHDDLCSHINLGLITQLQVCYYQSSFFIIASYKLYKKSGMHQCQHLNPLSLSLFLAYAKPLLRWILIATLVALLRPSSAEVTTLPDPASHVDLQLFLPILIPVLCNCTPCKSGLFKLSFSRSTGNITLKAEGSLSTKAQTLGLKEAITRVWKVRTVTFVTSQLIWQGLRAKSLPPSVPPSSVYVCMYAFWLLLHSFY